MTDTLQPDLPKSAHHPGERIKTLFLGKWLSSTPKSPPSARIKKGRDMGLSQKYIEAAPDWFILYFVVDQTGNCAGLIDNKILFRHPHIAEKNLFSPSSRRYLPRIGGWGEWSRTGNASGNLDAFHPGASPG